MKVLFLTHYFYPHIGGVEKHVLEISRDLIAKNHKVTIVTERYDDSLSEHEVFENIEIYRFSYPHKRFKGLSEIWKWLWKKRNLIKESDIIHCHDVFIWYLPFRFLFPLKKVFTTFHGWEGVYPIPLINILHKKLANLFSRKTIAIGKYIEKYYGIRTNKILYGGTDEVKKPKDKQSLAGKAGKIKNYLVFLGRLEKDTGLPEFLEWLEKNKKYQVDFIGDGSLHEECLKYGRILGFVDPSPFLERAKICVPGGYLSYIEAVSLGCRVITFASNELKDDYWAEIHSVYKNGKKIKKFPPWEAITNMYIKLWRKHV